MKEELEKELIKISPVFFEEMIECQEGTMNEMNTCMYWGCSCGDGWYEPIKKLAYKAKLINDIAKQYNTKYVANQIKEKFGGFRCYWCSKIVDESKPFDKNDKNIDCLYEMMREAVDACEEECWNTCETCGAEGGYKGENLVTTSGWISRICRKCSKKITEDETKRYDERNNQEYEPRITLFRTGYDFLNIKHISPFDYNDKYYQSVLQAYFCEKDPERKDVYSYLVRVDENCKLEVFAKMFGVEVEEQDYNLLKEIAFAKFNSQYNKRWKEELLETDGKKLINMNNNHDNLLGYCFCDKCKDIEKKNLWGKILMEIREIFLKNMENLEK